MPEPSFFLGHLCDPRTGERRGDRYLLPADHLTTHAVCVGMTGSGKTGLCVGLLEEAALAGIPALIVDPKGDMTNLALAFPRLRAQEFAPWVAAGASPEEVAAAWRAGLAADGRGPEDVDCYRESARVAIFTPGSTSGLGVDVLASLAAPDAAIRDEPEALADRVGGTVAALLGLLDRPADPVQSPEHVLLATILTEAWKAGETLDLTSLIARVQMPPFKTLGALGVEAVIPRKERDQLARSVNAVLAAPGFEMWRRGTPLDVEAMACPGGRSRLAVCSIAHLNDRERMFFVTLLFEAVITWMRRQSGSSALRLLLYFDEIAGYLPPHPADPPSKKPLLTLLKQARAFGIGCVLVTQNPVDLDYKALANAGLWFIGKLQTDQDRERVLGGMDASGKAEIKAMVAGLGQRRFVAHDVRERGPAVFSSRFALSYLAGPLTLAQIRALGQQTDSERRTEAKPSRAREAPPAAETPPVLPAGVAQAFIAGEGALHPYLYLRATLGYRDTKAGVNETRSVVVARPFDGASEWTGGGLLPAGEEPADVPPPGARFLALDPILADKGTWRVLGKSADDFLVRECVLALPCSSELSLVRRLGETPDSFRARCRQAAEARAADEIAAIDARVGNRRSQIEARLAREESELERDSATRDARAQEEKLSWLRAAGETLFALAGGRRSRSALGRIGSGVARSATQRRMRQGAELEVAESEEKIAALKAEIDGLEAEAEQEREAVRARSAVLADKADMLTIAPQKSTMTIHAAGMLWAPASLANRLSKPGALG